MPSRYHFEVSRHIWYSGLLNRLKTEKRLVLNYEAHSKVSRACLRDAVFVHIGATGGIESDKDIVSIDILEPRMISLWVFNIEGSVEHVIRFY